jgi:putative long chain acyl-CoA synthase
LASRFTPDVFWQEVRRYGVSVVFYAGEFLRELVRAPQVVGERNHPVRLFAGSGMRPDLWRRLTERFGAVGILEFYASTEASAVLANAAGDKIGAVGHPLPGSPHLAIAAYDADTEELVRDPRGRLVRARIDEPGMLVARLDSARGIADLAHIAPTRLIHDAFEPGDTWFVTGDLLRLDSAGDYWFVDRHGDLIRTAGGPVPSRRIEDALHSEDGVAACVAVAIADPAHPTKELPAAAFVLEPTATLDLAALTRAVQTLPDHARPVRLRRVATIPMTDGYRPLKQPIRELGFADGSDVSVWDPTLGRYRPTA